MSNRRKHNRKRKPNQAAQIVEVKADTAEAVTKPPLQSTIPMPMSYPGQTPAPRKCQHLRAII